MTLRRWLSPVLIATLLTAVVPANTSAAGSEPSKNRAPNPTDLKGAISRAASDAAVNPSLQLRAMTPSSGRQVRKQSTGGGGHTTAMVVSIVSAVVGIGATVYMVKEMEKTTKNLPQ
jgi:hypothetical protein